jgi:hypothetical protein
LDVVRFEKAQTKRPQLLPRKRRGGGQRSAAGLDVLLAKYTELNVMMVKASHLDIGRKSPSRSIFLVKCSFTSKDRVLIFSAERKPICLRYEKFGVKCDGYIQPRKFPSVAISTRK